MEKKSKVLKSSARPDSHAVLLPTASPQVWNFLSTQPYNLSGDIHMQALLEEERPPIWFNAVALLIWVTAGIVAFLPIALYTSPWDAVRFRVPGNEGNWWHLLIGAPYFLAFPMIWLRLRALFSKHLSTAEGRRLIWIFVALSICGTVLVEIPFLLRLGNLARMHAGRQLSIVGPTFGIIIVSGVLLFLKRRDMLPTRACLAGLNAAYLANASLCLFIYAPMPGTARSKSGWMVTVVIVWPMLLELVWILGLSFRTPAVSK